MFKDIFLNNLGVPGLADRPMIAELRFPEKAQNLPVCDCFGVRLFRSVPQTCILSFLMAYLIDFRLVSSAPTIV